MAAQFFESHVGFFSCFYVKCFLFGLHSGVCRNFSRGGGGQFFENFENFTDLFLGRSIWFSELSKNIIRTLFCQKKFCAAGNVFKKHFFKALFVKFLPKKLRFFGARSPLKINYFGAFRKILRLVSRKWMS